MSFYINGREGASVYIAGKTAFANYDPLNYAEIPSGDFAISYAALGDGLKDGDVPKGYVPDTTGYTAVAISNDSELQNFLGSDNTGKYGYLTANIATAITYTNDNYLNGILDGCGHTITANTDGYNDDRDSGLRYYGGLIREMYTGSAVKNLTYYSTARYYNTSGSNWLKQSFGCGVLVGRINAGTVSNIYVKFNCSNNFVEAMVTSGKHCNLGGITGQMLGGSIINTTVEVLNRLAIKTTRPGWATDNRDCYLCCGAFVGEATGSITLTNITATGSGIFNVNRADGQSGNGNAYGRIGALIGEIGSNAMAAVNGVKIGGTFNVEIPQVGSTKSRGLLFGFSNGKSDNFSVINLYYNTDLNNWCHRFNLTNWMSGDVENSAATDRREYSVTDDEIGFCHSQDKVYIGPAKWNAKNGTFIKALTINGTTLNGEDYRSLGVKGYTPVFSKSDITGDISAVSYGYYGYVSNEPGTATGSHKVYYKEGTFDYTSTLPATVPSYDAYESITKEIDNINVPFYLIKNTNINYYN